MRINFYINSWIFKFFKCFLCNVYEWSEFFINVLYWSRIFNCCKTTLIDYDVFFSFLERNHDLKVLDEFEHEEDDEEDYDDYDIEDGIHTGESKTSSPKRESRRRRREYTRAKSRMNMQENEKSHSDEEDISGNSQITLMLSKMPIRKRASSANTDYESDQEY